MKVPIDGGIFNEPNMTVNALFRIPFTIYFVAKRGSLLCLVRKEFDSGI